MMQGKGVEGETESGSLGEGYCRVANGGDGTEQDGGKGGPVLGPAMPPWAAAASSM